ncbi:hypothetical protein J2Z21_009424 [Streptomyces griseochromogenes]|uniref:Uncharacterized protein n=1 Tax=Streptomyces griseochromogenes TaxID=68214 RepID=A0ABS4M9Q1_9ACTN|nr:hypothetical protein [Streptomyces griseochromogenes]
MPPLRAHAALGQEWAHGPRRDRAVLIGVLRQGLRLARDLNLVELGWLTEAAFSYVGDSVWGPLLPTAGRADRHALEDLAGPEPDRRLRLAPTVTPHGIAQQSLLHS